MKYQSMSSHNITALPVQSLCHGLSTLATQSIMMVPTQEYEALVNENIRLKEEIRILKGDADILRQNSLRDVAELEMLRRENAELKEQLSRLQMRVTSLENDNIQLKADNIQLKADNEQLKADNKELKEENKQLKVDVNDIRQSMIDEKLMSKLMISIQDINTSDSLEKVLKYPSNRFMKKLRESRNGDFHYILVTDPSTLVQYKRKVLHDKLDGLSDQFKQKFERKFGQGLVGELTKILSDVYSTSTVQSLPKAEEQEDADEWWTD